MRLEGMIAWRLVRTTWGAKQALYADLLGRLQKSGRKGQTPASASPGT